MPKIKPESVIVIHPVFKSKPASMALSDDALSEAVGLANAIRLQVVHKEVIRLSKLSSATLIGAGVIERLAEVIVEKEVSLLYINHPLTPVQQRNLEKELEVKVIDRTGLILEIFGDRAVTKEGKLQVELATLDFQRSRLVRAWTHLERQRGGFGFTGGPGETQIELDRRIIGERIVRLKKELEQVKKNRRLQRASRERTPFPIVALVGYTNAGKSTLFNAITGANVFAEDLLFATLDPTMRSCVLPSGKKIILSDTVGFISDLPTSLVASFRATLEEVQNASLILYIRDVIHKDTKSERASVSSILKDLDIDIDSDERVFEVLNKIDLCDEETKEKFVNIAGLDSNKIALSAISGEGQKSLLEVIDNFLAKDEQFIEVSLDITTDGEAISWLYDHGVVIKRKDKDFTGVFNVRLSEKNVNRFQKQFKNIKMHITYDRGQNYKSA